MMRDSLMKLASADRTTLLLTLFVITDGVFMIAHLLHLHSTYIGFFGDPEFAATQERGLAETFQYLKEGWIGLTLVGLAIRVPNLLYPAWALLFGYFLVDDLFQLHERLGGRISHHFGFPEMLALRPQDFGELTVTAGAALFFAVVIGLGHYRADPGARAFSRSMFLLVVGLAFFGVLVDMIHVMLKHPAWQLALDIVENGGERVMMSVIAWFVFRAYPEASGASGVR